MGFTSAFLRALPGRPVRAFAALYWQIRGQSQLARDYVRPGLVSSPQPPRAYQKWIATVEQPGAVLAAAQSEIEGWPTHPRLSVIVYQQPGQRLAQIERVFDALAAQAYPDWELVLVQSYDSPPPRTLAVPRLTLVPSRAGNAAQALALGAQVATGEFLLPLMADTLLPPTALYRYAEALQDEPGATVLFGDEDTIDKRGRRTRPWFKPRWNAEMFLGQDYLSGACLIRADAARRALPLHAGVAGAALYTLLLRVTDEAGARVVHVPHVVCHRLGAPDSALAQANRASALARHLADTGAAVHSGPHGTLRVDWPLPDVRPLVSIIVPAGPDAVQLRACVSRLLSSTRYAPYEILLVEQTPPDEAMRDYLSRVGKNPKVLVLTHERPLTTASAINAAVRTARGDYLCLLCGDVDVLDENWLTALMRQAVRPEVGAAGAKLLHDDGTIHHAGMVLGLGATVGNAHRFEPDDEPGYFAQPHVARFVTAVTGACLLVEKRKFEAVGGLDERDLPMAFSDVDLCLKLEKAGWRNAFVPQAVLVRHTGRPRPREVKAEPADFVRSELRVLRERWGAQDWRDPLHHPHLDPTSERYIIRLGS